MPRFAAGNVNKALHAEETMFSDVGISYNQQFETTASPGDRRKE